ncbi:uncharacterized protein BYT42DRAFT_549880 [Radiomyces spectabilis]|uniref:uncharacterized protein n=1 Tax=Radiomyces spectabilis TaxID=64574 RepID=UPI0022204B2A|nr:uncharacterized protein BYT42DRAFT_549880 [Radiomyces spectabilis]KAI8366821.1 hypothetical protein BYT42DRAFT_549880 [Radiomyces spectabilis]
MSAALLTCLEFVADDFLPDMAAKYEGLWKRCLKSHVYLEVRWENIACHALHAIFPLIFDNFWIKRAARGEVSGVLVLRVDCSPVGVAFIRDLIVAAQHATFIKPDLKNCFKDELLYLDDLATTICDNRWIGSINCRMYGAKNLQVDEVRLAKLASAILAMLEAFNPQSPLIKSGSLKRIADDTPITGCILPRVAT